MYVKNLYTLKTSLTNTEIMRRFHESTHFIHEESASYSGQLRTQSNISKIYMYENGSDTIQFSENAGLGGIFEINCECKIKSETSSTSEIVTKFKMGVFPVNIPLVFGLILILCSLFTLSEGSSSYIFIGAGAFCIFFYLLKYTMVRIFLNKLADALGMNKRSWN